MITLDEIYQFISPYIDDGKEYLLNKNSDIYKDFDVNGDDFFEMMESFVEEYCVDISNYNWFFHHECEGYLLSWTAKFFKPQRERIPITPKLLLESANTRKWPLVYPPDPPDLPWRLIHFLDLLFILFLLPFFIPICVLALIYFYQYIILH